MKTLIASTAVRVTVLLLAPWAGSTAAASPAPTLIRLEPAAAGQPTAVMRATESCVALLQARSLAAAATVCNSAVAAAEHDRASAWGAPFTPRGVQEGIAIAYNNRAVLRYLSGELALAAADATRAIDAAAVPGIGDTVAVIDAARRRAAGR